MSLTMKHSRFSILSALLVACSLAFAGCAGMTQQQIIAANVEGAGEAVGVKLLKAHETNGAVDLVYLSSFVDEIPKVANAMQGAITPADLHVILNNTQGLSSDQLAAVAYLDGVSPEFIAVNGGTTPTIDGAIADASFKQFAAGLGRSVGLVTGQNYSPPAK